MRPTSAKGGGSPDTAECRERVRTMKPSAWLGLGVALAAGAALRLAWGGDIEWKGDERFFFDQAMRVGRELPWRWTGISTSVHVPSPGLSGWVFVVIARAFGVTNPPELARAIQLINLAALVGVAVFVTVSVPVASREHWYWGIALYAVNPLAVTLERKIWNPSILPMFVVLFLVGWWHRHRAWGAFVCGAIGAAVGQVHMAGFFFAAAIVTWTAYWDRHSTRWGAWIVGSCSTAWPLIPWAYCVWSQASVGATPPILGARLPVGTFYTRWVTEPWGLTADYTLGRGHYFELLARPALGGRATYLLAVLHAAVAALAIAAYAGALRTVWAQRSTWRAVAIGTTPAGRLAAAVLWLQGGLLTISTLSIHRHYGAAVYVIKYVWMASVVFCAFRPPRARAVLTAVVVAQGLISFALLSYIHDTQVIRGEFGATWQSQQR